MNTIHPSAVMHSSTTIGDRVRIGANVVIDDGVSIGNNVAIWNCTVIRSRVKIGDGTVIGHLCLVERDTKIGSDTIIQSQTHITAEAMIGNKVFIGPSVVIINEKRIASHNRKIPQKLEGPIIEDGARIGAAALILPGVKIGEQAFVGAGSIVYEDVPPRVLYICRDRIPTIKKISEEELL